VIRWVVGTVIITVEGTVDGRTEKVTMTTPGDVLIVTIAVDGTDEGTSVVGTITGDDQVDGTVTYFGILFVFGVEITTVGTTTI
jgi:hypothetical protein